MAAFRRCVELGVTTLELDAQVSADGVLVAHHDQALDPSRCRTSGGGAPSARLVRDMEWDELSRVECTPGHPLVRVEDVLVLAREASRPVHLSIELKMQDEGRGVPVQEFARLLVDLITRTGCRDRVLVQSFRPEALREVRRLAPDLPTAILVRDSRDYERLLEESGASVLAPRRDDLRRVHVEALHARGALVIPWVVNDIEEMRRFAEWGVDGLVTDRPDLALELVREQGE